VYESLFLAGNFTELGLFRQGQGSVGNVPAQKWRSIVGMGTFKGGFDGMEGLVATSYFLGCRSRDQQTLLREIPRF